MNREIYLADATSSEDNGDLSSTNWSGGLLAAPSGESFTSVTATITVPTVTGPSDAYYSAYAWIGIDGWEDAQNIWQAGLDIRGVEQGGEIVPILDGWYEWYPLNPEFISVSDLPISAGDSLFMNVTLYTSTSGIMILENLTTGKSVQRTMEEPKYPLQGAYAEWILEGFYNSDTQQLQALPDFGSIVFSDTTATTSSGNVYNAESASLVQLAEPGLSASMSGSSVNIRRD
jgi:hypothetical protein